MKMLSAFDLEVAAEVPEGGDWDTYWPLGIICAGVGESSKVGRIHSISYHHHICKNDRMSKFEAVALVRTLMDINSVRPIVTWNGAAFDFKVLAAESGMHKECAYLAWNHIDLMFIVVTMRGHFLGLDAALKGAIDRGAMGITEKLHTVTLKDGTDFGGMNGALAPKLWKEGEREAVLAYQKEDVVQLLNLAIWIQKTRELTWTARSGRENYVYIPELLTVAECMDLRDPDNSWMQNPPSRSAMLAWTEDDPDEFMKKWGGK